MPRAWNNWFHCTLTAYGNWLPGDSRGWREQHHRRHVDGDYTRQGNGGYDRGVPVSENSSTRSVSTGAG